MTYKHTDVSELLGKTLLSVEKTTKDWEADCITFKTIDGKQYDMWHIQDCCEHVELEDICGDLNDLVGTPILLAQETWNNETDAYEEAFERPTDYANDSHTWTFYKFATIKGSVTLRWLGESNGCYSESVDFCEIIED